MGEHTKRQSLNQPDHQPQFKRQNLGQNNVGGTYKEEIKQRMIAHGNRSNYATNSNVGQANPIINTLQNPIVLGNPLYRVVRPPPNAAIKPMPPALRHLVNVTSARPPSVVTLNTSCTAVNINGIRMPVNAAGNHLRGNVIGVHRNVPGKSPGANVIRMPHNAFNNRLNSSAIRVPVNGTPHNTLSVVNPTFVHTTNIRTHSNLIKSPNPLTCMSANPVGNHWHRNILRTHGSTLGNPSNVVNRIPGNIARNPVQPNNIRTIGSTVSAVNRMPVNVVRSPLLGNVIGNRLYPVVARPTSTPILKPVIPGVRHIINPMQIRPPGRVAPLQYIPPGNIPVMRQNTPLLIRYNTIPSLLKNPRIATGLNIQQRSNQLIFHTVQNNFKTDHYGNHNNRKFTQIRSTVPHLQKNNPGSSRTTEIVENEEIYKNNELLEISKGKPWFDNHCHCLHKKRQQILTLLKKAIKENNEKEIEELSERIKENNSDYIPLTRDRKTNYITELESKGEFGSICEIVVASVVGEVMKLLKSESTATEMLGSDDSLPQLINKSVYSYDSLRDILTDEDFEEMEDAIEDACVGEDVGNTEEAVEVKDSIDEMKVLKCVDNEVENDVDCTNVDVIPKELEEIACNSDVGFKMDMENTEEVKGSSSEDVNETEQKQIVPGDRDVNNEKMDNDEVAKAEVDSAYDKGNMEEIKPDEQEGKDEEDVIHKDENVQDIIPEVNEINASVCTKDVTHRNIDSESSGFAISDEYEGKEGKIELVECENVNTDNVMDGKVERNDSFGVETVHHKDVNCTSTINVDETENGKLLKDNKDAEDIKKLKKQNRETETETETEDSDEIMKPDISNKKGKKLESTKNERRRSGRRKAR